MKDSLFATKLTDILALKKPKTDGERSIESLSHNKQGNGVE